VKLHPDFVNISVSTMTEADDNTQHNSAPGPPTGFGISRVSNFAEVPDFVFPSKPTHFFSNI
jgi:hypothetical protein